MLSTGKINNIMTKPRYLRLILAIVLIACGLFQQCSSPTDSDKTATLTVTPSSGFPGTVLKVSGVTGLAPESDTLTATIGGNTAPVIVGDSGQVLVAVPLFFDDSGIVTVPAEALDLTLFSNGTKLGEASKAISVEALPAPTHSLADVTSSLETISATLDTIISSFSSGPGIEEQYVRAIMAGLDSLIKASDPLSLASATGGISADSSLAYVTAVLDANGVIEGLMNMATQLREISLPATTSAISTGDVSLYRSPSSALIPTLITDQDLARRMQFYVIAKMFGETVISQTGQTFAETVGLAAGAIGIVANVPVVGVVSAVLTFIDVIVNKIVVGALPATIDSMSVAFADNTIHPGDTTEATVYILASNLPPGLGVQDLIGLTLTVLGLRGGGSPDIATFKAILLNTANFFIGTMRSIVASYSAQHPELNLDVNVVAFVPLMKWEAYINDPHLVTCQSLTPSIVTGMSTSPNWQADASNYGEGRVYVMPATGANVLLLPLPPGFTYNGGAFGMDMPASRTKSVWVKPELALQIDFANIISVNGANVLGIDAGYFDSNGNPQWAPDIQIDLSVTNGTASVTSGLTDAQGHFNSIISLDPSSDTVTVHIFAYGLHNSQADAIVKAHLLDTLGSGWVITCVDPSPPGSNARANIYLNISTLSGSDGDNAWVNNNSSVNETACMTGNPLIAGESGSVSAASTSASASGGGSSTNSFFPLYGDSNNYQGFTATGTCDANISWSGIVDKYDSHSTMSSSAGARWSVSLIADSGYFEVTTEVLLTASGNYNSGMSGMRGDGYFTDNVGMEHIEYEGTKSFTHTFLLTPGSRYYVNASFGALTNWNKQDGPGGDQQVSVSYNVICNIRRLPYP